MLGSEVDQRRLQDRQDTETQRTHWRIKMQGDTAQMLEE